ncbi:MAG: thiamine pyrophosphate-binding protein [Candidatus Hydrogenedens sp.]|nr:thiamine pyrophosphate-binding protein [Candidatus Hydrogenedens sp.]
MEKTLGGDLVAKMLKAEGVEFVFGIIDGTYFGFYSSLERNGIKLISPRHEACAVHMAGAYARATGKLGVCMASNGPGVANALPGVAVENGEANRVLLITSTRRTGIGYPDRGGTFQYFNQVAVMKPMTKWSGAVPDVGRIPEMMKRAFRMSWKGRPGVVHVDIPENILNSKWEAPALPAYGTYRRMDPISPARAHVVQAADMIQAAEVPIIHAGSGVIHAGAFAELRELAELMQMPVTTSWAGRAVIDERCAISVPMIFVKLNNEVRNRADLVLTLGSRIGETDWWGKAPYWAQASKQKMIQVDNDEDMLGLNKPAELCVLSDAREFLRELVAELKARGAKAAESAKAFAAEVYKKRTQERERLNKKLKDMEDPLNTAHVATAAQAAFGDDAILVIDGGNTAIWANFFHEVRVPGSVLYTFKFGMLGAGVAQALGAAIAFPKRPVYCMIGDGAMGFNQQEVETAVRNNLPVTYLVCADKQWGMVKMNQQFALKPIKTLLFKSLGPDETINADFQEIRFDKLGEAMGAHGERVSSPAELGPALERARKSGKCAVIHIDVDPVKHMWAPSLREFKDMHAEPAGR